MRIWDRPHGGCSTSSIEPQRGRFTSRAETIYFHAPSRHDLKNACAMVRRLSRSVRTTVPPGSRSTAEVKQKVSAEIVSYVRLRSRLCGRCFQKLDLPGINRE